MKIMFDNEVGKIETIGMSAGNEINKQEE